MDEEIKEVGEMATIEDEEEITIEEDYTALEAETVIIDDDSNIQTEAEYEQAVGQKELADEAREALSAVLLSVLEKGEINDDDIAEIAAQQEIYTENVTALKILGLTTEDEKSTAGKSTTNVITSNIDYDELIKVLSEKADWLYTDEDGQVMLNGEVVPKIKVVELEAEKIKADVGEFKNLTTENFTATNATIENLKANKADIEYLNANYATIQNLNATNANITNLQATKANITDLNAANANINTLTGNLADITTLVNGNLTSDNIQSMVITGDKFTVANGFIKNAMIDSINANKINTGTINTNNVSIQSADGSMMISGTTQQFKDENNKVRIQIGKDAQGNFTFALFSQDGVGVLIDETGIKSGAVPNGLIVNDMVSDGANISGSKLDINSVINSINNGTTTIQGTRIQLDEQGQSLQVAFSQLKNKVETIENISIEGDLSSVIEQVTSNTTSINTMQGQISSLISNTTITKSNGEVVQLKDEYNSTKSTVDSHSTKIGSLETNLTTANNNISSVSSKQTALEQNLNGFKQTVSDTYTTKAEFDGLQVGGTNLLPKSGNFKDNTGLWVSNGANITLDSSAIYSGYSTIKIVGNGGASYDGFIQLKANTTYTYSVLAKASSDIVGNYITPLHMWLSTVQDSQHLETVIAHNSSIGTKWTKAWVTFKTPNDGDIYYMKPFIYNIGDATVWLANAKVEEGNKATDWSPSPTDIDASIATVDGKFVNYSTTSAMNSAINQKANEITSTVSETYATKSEFNDLDIGGTNLYPNSNFKTEPTYTEQIGGSQITWNSIIDSDTVTTKYNGNLVQLYDSQGTSSSPKDVYLTFGQTSTLQPNTTYTLSFDYYSIGAFAGSSSYIYLWKTKYDVSTRKVINLGVTNNKKNRTRLVTRFTTDSEHLIFQFRIGFLDTGPCWLAVDGVKLEEGNRATAWSPSPEDIDNSITAVDNKFVNYSTTQQMNSAIDQKAGSILSTVSSTYATTQSTSTLLKENITEYYLSTSNTTLSGGTWGTTAYTPTPGKYIWQRTKSVTNAGDIKYSNPICVSDEMYTVILKNEVLLLKCNSDGEVI